MSSDEQTRVGTRALWLPVVAALLAAGSRAVPSPGSSRTRPARPRVSELYQAVIRADRAGLSGEYEQATRAVLARGEEAVDFLVNLAEVQAERVRTEKDLSGSGLVVTLNLLGRMNAYPRARLTLERLRAHPLEQVRRWAEYALRRTPQTRPTAPAPVTRPSARAEERRVRGDRIVTPRGWFARPKVKRPALPAKVTRAFVIPIREEISTKTFKALRRKALRCKAAGAQLIVLDMDTWGGAVLPALDIARLLKHDLADIYTVCFVRTRGVSAGALIALACDEIVMTPVGKLGDCAPIVTGGKLEGVEREKIESVLRKELEESARRNGYCPALAVSMVSYDRQVLLIHNRITGELRYVLNEKRWRGRINTHGRVEGPSDPDSEWDLLEVVVAKGELLTMRPEEAVAMGFASRIVRPDPQRPYRALLKHYNVVGEPVVLTDNWSERLVALLTSPAVFGFLMFVALLCAYVEVNTPGFGVPGAVAIACFALLFGSRYLTGLANWWEIAVFALGVLLLLLEVFVTPGFGVLGVAGILACIAMVVPNPPGRLPWPDSPLSWSVFETGVLSMLLGFAAAVIGAATLSRFLPKMPIASKLFLAPPEPPGEGAVGERSPFRAVGPGAVGVVEATCRPVGKVRFGEELLDAQADGAVIPAGRNVRVLRREGNRVVVEPLEET